MDKPKQGQIIINVTETEEGIEVEHTVKNVSIETLLALGKEGIIGTDFIAQVMKRHAITQVLNQLKGVL